MNQLNTPLCFCILHLLVTEALHSRLSFLHEIRGFGVHEHDDYINNQLGEIRKEMEDLKLGGSSSSGEATADF